MRKINLDVRDENNIPFPLFQAIILDFLKVDNFLLQLIFAGLYVVGWCYFATVFSYTREMR